MRSRLYLNRWLTFAASCLLQVSAGLSYAYSMYAPALKERWGFSETAMLTIGSCLNFGGYLAIPSGALYDRLERHKRFGPRLVALIGVVLLVVGYMGLAAAAAGLLAPNYAFVCVCAFLGGNSSTWFDTAAVVTNVRNFPRDRGTVVGILKAFVGLSASVYSSIYAAEFQPDAVGFLDFIGSAPAVLLLILISLMNLVPEAYHEPEEKKETSKEGGAGDASGSKRHEHAAGSGSGSGRRRKRRSAGGGATSGPEDGLNEPLLSAAADPAASPRPAPHANGGPSSGTHQPQPEPQSKPGPASAGPGPGPGPAPGPRAPRLSTSARFTLVYSLVCVIALFQTGAALWSAVVAHRPHGGPSQSARRALLAGVCCLVGTLVLVPWGSGDWVHRKPRPEAVERARRSLLARLARGASLSLRRRRGSGEAGGGGGGGGGGAGGVGGSAAGAGVVGEGAGVGVAAPAAAAAALPCGGAGPGPGAEAEAEQGEAGAGGGAAVPAPAPAPSPTSPPPKPEPVTPAASVDLGALTGGGPEVVVEAPPLVDPALIEARLEALEEVPSLPDLALGQAARRTEFWLLLFQFSVGLGTGLAFLNNLGSITVALGGSPGGQVVFVSLFSVANAIGRLSGGVVSEAALRRYRLPRTSLLLGASCLTLAGVGGALLCEHPANLAPVSLVVGFAFGSHWGLIPAITSDLFGLTHFGSNYTGLQLGPAFGGYLLATVLTGRLYDRVVRRHGDTLFCIGSDCYFETWCVLGFLNLLSLLGTRELHAQTAKLYRRIIRQGGV
ncbi:hypothetical protein HYH03_005688 [Edaphochlamys debaryana]|uniref:Nodulin-like domain-containing protein n=1 Tax=Edaphochlamys debaryana TaxID=47281 RepID=A0A835YEE7_9CHLO|nr:hypothetical protein HYH03_005688 [Edaphochlamys debaryana]|eukprot:KAG2496084.1 hypothetical protein HYH03_005688 [Edaphochlamys debaryana]